MRDKYDAANRTDDKGNPAGGTVRGTGLTIDWQSGPLGRGEARQRPTGAFVETVIAAVAERIEFYQKTSGGKFTCVENDVAIGHLTAALKALEGRTARRDKAGTEGTHTPDACECGCGSVGGAK